MSKVDTFQLLRLRRIHPLGPNYFFLFSSITVIMDKVFISISGQKNNESYPLCSLDKRSIPDPHFILNLAIFRDKKSHTVHSSHLC